MLEKTFNDKSLATIVIPLVVIVFSSFVILSLAPNYYLVFAVVSVPFLFVYILDKPFLLLQMLIIIMPFTEMPSLNIQIYGVPGLKVMNILFVVTALAFVLSRLTINISFHEKLFIGGMLFLLFIAVIRSIPHLHVINLGMGKDVGVVRYFQSYLLKPIIYFSPFIFIALYVSDFEKIKVLLKTFVFSIFNFSIVLVAIYVFLTPDKTDFQNIKASFDLILHLHGNTLATIYLLSFPLLISYFFIEKNVFSILSVILCLISIGFFYARTAYVLVLVSLIMYLFFTKRISWAPIIGGFLVVLISLLPGSIIERALTGVEGKDVSKISSGRVSGIWLPLIDETSRSPRKLILGSGRHATIFSDSYKYGNIERVGHAHNLYLNTILETGLVGLAFFALFYTNYLKKIFKAIKRNLHGGSENEILYGVAVSVLSYFIAGMTGRQMFPIIYNYPLWFVLALGFSILKFLAKKEAN